MSFPLEVRQIDHLGIAVWSIEQALPFYRDILGLTLCEVEEVKEQQVRVAVLRLGDSCLELLEPAHPASGLARFLETRGAGIHHLALRVTNVADSLAALGAAGYQLIDLVPRRGAKGTSIGFIHPKSVHGVLLELVAVAA